VLLVVLVAIAGGVAAFLLVNDSSGSGSGGNKNAGAAPSATNATITGATSFDPLGDGTESPDLVGNATDDDPTTAWSTEQYDQFPDGPKTGVGVALALDREYDVSKVTVDALRAGWGASIYVSDQPVANLTKLADWGDARASGSDLDRTKTFEFSGVKGQSVLVWFTQLPASQNNSGATKHFVDVTEVKVA
jgi:hypothetical protein